MSLSPATLAAIKEAEAIGVTVLDILAGVLQVAGVSEDTVIKVARAGVPMPPLDPVGPDVDAEYQAAKKA